MSQGQSSKANQLSQSKEQQLKTYQRQLKDNVKSMCDNFTAILNHAKISEDNQIAKATQAEQEQLEMNVRAANMVRAGQSLLELVGQLKLFLVLNDTQTAGEADLQVLQETRQSRDRALRQIRDSMAAELHEIEEEYYASPCK